MPMSAWNTRSARRAAAGHVLQPPGTGLLRLPDSEPRIVADVLIPPSVTSRWVNALDGYARGVELLVQRRSTNGLSGWVSYSFGVNRYEDTMTGERSTATSISGTRSTPTACIASRIAFSLAAKLRIGSNVPAAGYWEQRGDEYFVGTTRNEFRVPPYSRLDIRANRTFNRQASGSRCSSSS